MANSLEELRKRYSTLTTEELFEIAATKSNEYQPRAVGVAQEELRRRGVPEGGTAELRERAEAERQAAVDIEERPLSVRLCSSLSTS